MAKNIRTVDISALQDPLQIKAIEYNPAAGAQKSLPIGPHLLPIPIVTAGTPTWKTDVSTVTALPLIGMNLAIYNNAGAAGSITIGNTSGLTSQAIGASDANGNVGVACPPNAWTYLSMGANQWIISSAATLIVYIIEDPTSIARESGAYIQEQDPRTFLPLNS